MEAFSAIMTLLTLTRLSPSLNISQQLHHLLPRCRRHLKAEAREEKHLSDARNSTTGPLAPCVRVARSDRGHDGAVHYTQALQSMPEERVDQLVLAERGLQALASFF